MSFWLLYRVLPHGGHHVRPWALRFAQGFRPFTAGLTGQVQLRKVSHGLFCQAGIHLWLILPLIKDLEIDRSISFSKVYDCIHTGSLNHRIIEDFLQQLGTRLINTRGD